MPEVLFFHLILSEFATCSGTALVFKNFSYGSDSLAIAVRRLLAELKRERHLLTEFLCIPSFSEISRLNGPNAAISIIFAL